MAIMAAIMAVMAMPAFAAAIPRFYLENAWPSKVTITGGTEIPPVVCDMEAADATLIGWRNDRCWVFHPVPNSNFRASIGGGPVTG
jgi:hypothetical protein